MYIGCVTFLQQALMLDNAGSMLGHKSYALLANAVMPKQSMLSNEVGQNCEPASKCSGMSKFACTYCMATAGTQNTLSPVPLRHSQRLVWQSPRLA